MTMRKIRGSELKRFKKLEGEYHYMGETRSAGDTLRLVAEEDGEWVALMVWGSACTASRTVTRTSAGQRR